MSKSKTNVDCLVIGAGPVGLTMAAELIRHGLTVKIIEQNQSRSKTSKALAVWSRTSEILNDMGCVQAFKDVGLEVRDAYIFNQKEKLLHLSFTGLPTDFSYALLIPQSESERLLDEHLHSLKGKVEWSTELLNFEQHEDYVTATIKNKSGEEELVECSWLLGCGGAHSPVRHHLNIPFAGDSNPNDWILADGKITGSNLPEKSACVFLHHQGILLFFPISENHYRVVADLGVSKSAVAPETPTEEEVQKLIDVRGPGGLILSEVTWLSGFRINTRKVESYQYGRVFLAGDAAHVHSPAGGQGMNTGMQDAYNLAWKLALVHKGKAKPSLLDSYSKERSLIGRQVLNMTKAVTKMVTLRNPLLQSFRNFIIRMVNKLTFIKYKAKLTVTELAIHYRNSPLTCPASATGIRAGDRTPYEYQQYTKGTKHNLLISPKTKKADDIESMIQKRFIDIIDIHKTKLPGQIKLMLIRPDGYIGFLDEDADYVALSHHLETYLT